MRLTIIPDDGVLGIDGVFRPVNLSALVSTVHAVQFDTTKGTGTVERRDAKNEALTSFSAYQTYYDAWVAAAPPALTPGEVFAVAKAAKLAQLKQAHQTATYADVTAAGKVYPADRDYQFIILTMASRANRSRPIPATIRGKDGVAATLTPALLGLIEDAMFDQGKNASDNLAAKVALVSAATTVPAIDAITW